MLNVQLDEVNGIVTLVPEGKLEKSDFESAATQIDPLIEKLGKLKGLIIHVEHFPGWDSFGALATHLSFVKEHHRKVARIAFVTDSPMGGMAEKVGNHFVSAEIKDFPFAGLEQGKNWILGV